MMHATYQQYMHDHPVHEGCIVQYNTYSSTCIMQYMQYHSLQCVAASVVRLTAVAVWLSCTSLPSPARHTT